MPPVPPVEGASRTFNCEFGRQTDVVSKAFLGSRVTTSLPLFFISLGGRAGDTSVIWEHVGVSLDSLGGKHI